MQELANVISSLGYPIVMSLLLLYMMYDNEKKYDETIEGLRKTIENNTLTLTKLCERLETGSDKDEKEQTVRGIENGQS